MTRKEELKLFLDVADELIESKYILADVRIVNLLKSISISSSLVAVFQNCLSNFDYIEAKKKYLVKNKYLSGEKGEFILPDNTKDLLAFVFTTLVDIDAKRIDFASFLTQYFYEDGSFTASYSSFINAMIKPFRNSVKTIMESVIDGKVQDPIDAFIKEEERKKTDLLEQEKQKQKEIELLQRENGKNIKNILDVLKSVEDKINRSEIKDKKQVLIIIDMLENAMESQDKDAIAYSFLSYSYMAKSHPILLRKSVKTIRGLLKGIADEL